VDWHSHANSLPRISLHRGIAFFIGQRAEEAYRLSEQRITHSKVLVEKNIRHRLGISIRAYGYMGKLHINEPILTEEREASDYKEYSSNVEAHLESGYKEKILVHWEKMNSHIEIYNGMVETLRDNVVKSIIQRIKEELPLFVEFNKSDEKPLKCFIPERLSYDVSYALQYYLDCNVIFDMNQFSHIDPEGNKWKLSINAVFAESDSKDELQKIQLIIEAVLTDRNTVERLEKLTQCRKDAEKELQSFKEKLTEIIKLVENGIPLEGKCEICKGFSKKS
jgi:hypothetical protein